MEYKPGRRPSNPQPNPAGPRPSGPSPSGPAGPSPVVQGLRVPQANRNQHRES